MDPAIDPRFNLLPERLQKDLKAYEYTGQVRGTPYQEVQFELDDIVVQTAIFEKKYTTLPFDQIKRLGTVIKVWEKKDLNL